ncbi:MAG: DUF4328 domain-containing protein [Myxococcota bacterium]|nr:DUF4328 domain-containing protein [Myxococcota bacterium]
MNEYSSLKTLALATMVFLALNGLASLVAIPSAMMQMDVLDRIDQGTIGQDEIEANDARESALGLVTMGLYFVTAIVFVAWFHRAYKNLDHFGHQREHGTGWAIGAWIAPIISLFRPFQMAREIWHASDPERGNEWAPPSSPPLLSTWWALWIIGNVVGQIAFRMSLGAETVDDFRTSTTVQIGIDALNLVSVPFAILVVRELTRRQETRAERMARGAEDLAKVFE